MGNNHLFKEYYCCYPNPELDEGNRIILPESALFILIEQDVYFPYFFRINKFHISDNDSDAVTSDSDYNSYEEEEEDDFSNHSEEDGDEVSSHINVNKEDEVSNNVSEEEVSNVKEDDKEDNDEIESKEMNELKKWSHCGVIEFTSQEGIALIPQWMMTNLGIEKGDKIVLRNVDLENGIYLKLNPLNENFLKLNNPKVILEKKLRGFACLTPGDIFPIVHNDVKYDIEVVETNPSIGISVIETDCEVDFSLPAEKLSLPVETKTERRPVMADSKYNVAVITEKMEKFTPFSGRARRLDNNEKSVEAVERDASGSRCPANAAVVKPSEEKFVAFSGKKYSLMS